MVILQDTVPVVSEIFYNAVGRCLISFLFIYSFVAVLLLCFYWNVYKSRKVINYIWTQHCCPLNTAENIFNCNGNSATVKAEEHSTFLINNSKCVLMFLNKL